MKHRAAKPVRPARGARQDAVLDESASTTPGQTPKRAGTGALVGVGLTLAVVAAGAGLARAADTPRPDAMVRSWDHNVLNLDWTGDVYYETVLSNDTFHHAPVAVPGDFVYRTLRVTNDTPCGAELTVSIVNAESVEDPDTVNDKNGAFEDISQLRWDVGGTQGSAVFSDLVATGGRELATIPIAEQATEQVKIAYTFDFDAETGKHMGQVSQELRYDVELILRGDHCASESTGGNKQTGSNSPPPTTPTADPPTVPPSDPPKEDLPVTGSNIAFAAISAAFLIMAGATILSGRRRNRKARAES